MGKLRRFYKRYERTFMLGIVIMLLATFSVTSALCGGGGGPQQGGYELGGSFQVSPKERESLSDSGFDETFAGWQQLMRATMMPSIAFREHLMGGQPPNPVTGAWAAYAAHRAADNAGYVVGPHQLKSGVRDMVTFRMRMAVTDEIYAKFLRDSYRGSAASFQESVRQVLLRDAFLDPLVQVARYAMTYEEAFEEWKRQRERVDLEYIALSGEPFAEIVRLEEKSRIEIGAREESLLKVRMALSQIRSLSTHLEALKLQPGGDGLYPEKLDAIVEAKRVPSLPQDPWDGSWTYTRTEEGKSFTLSSMGPDGKAGTADDVSRGTLQEVVTHGNLRDMVRGIYEWHGGAKAWPKTLKDLTTPAVEDSAPPMARLRQDGHEQDFVYEPAAEGGVPSIIAIGPDGKAGTDDDSKFTFEAEGSAATSTLPMGPGLATLMSGDEKDAWDRPLNVVLESALPITWRVFSAGPDGKIGTDDDVEGGNRRAMEDFFARPSVKQEYRLPLRRQIEALHVQLPVFPDAVLKRLWEDYAHLQPKDEDQLFQTWQEHRGPGRLYSAEDPADKEKGHGAALAKRIAPEGEHYLVPAKGIFPAKLGSGDPKKDDEGEPEKDDEGEPEKDEEGEPKKDGEGEPKEDKKDALEVLRKEYREKGWRRILIRERFMDNLLRDLLQRLEDSRLAVKKWEDQWAEAADDAPVPVKPEQLTFDLLLEKELNPYLVGAAQADKGNQTFRLYRTKVDPDGPEEQGDERSDWEAHDEFGDTIITIDLSGRTQDGEYVKRVVPIHERKGRILLRNLKFFPARDQRLEEVRDQVFDLFVKDRQTARAVRALKELQEKAPVPSKDEDLAATEEKWTKVLAEWSKEIGVPHVRARTGLFIGATPPVSITLEEDENGKLPTDEASMAIRRRNFVWSTGYDTIQPLGSRQDPTSGEPGTFGRRVLPDRSLDEGGTGSAYLIRVADRVFPEKAEFSPKRYTEFLGRKAFGGSAGPRSRTQIRDREGSFYVALGKFMEDPDFLRGVWGLRTNSPLESFDR